MSTYTGNPNNGITVASAIPDDGKKLKASDVNTPLEAIFDSLAYIKGRGAVGAFKTDLNSDPILAVETFSSTSYTASSLIVLDLPTNVVSVGDLVLVELSTLLKFIGGGALQFASLRVSATQGFGGGSPVTAAVPGARMALPDGGGSFWDTGAAFGLITISQAGVLHIFAEGKVAGGGQSLNRYSTGALRATVLRSI